MSLKIQQLQTDTLYNSIMTKIELVFMKINTQSLFTLVQHY